MKHRLITVLAAAFLVTAYSVGPVSAEDPQADEPVDGRRIEFALGAGASIGLDSDVPVDDNLLYGGSLTIELNDRFDAEFGMLVHDTHTDVDESSGEESEHQTVNYVYGGFRFYPLKPSESAVKPYLFMGLAEYWGLEPGENELGYMIGPGLRFQPGERFGFTLKSPIVIQFDDEAYARMMPHIEFYWKFDFANGGFH